MTSSRGSTLRSRTTPVSRLSRVLRACALGLSLLAAPLLAGACAGTSDAGGGASGGGADGLERPNVGDVEPGDPVRGEVFVTWKNLNPRNPDVTQTLVNESSEVGQQLRSGRKSSTAVRVISDADMGTLLLKLKEIGFYDQATRGVGPNSIPQVPGRRGIVLVHDNGTDWGLMLTPGAGGTPLPATYRDCKGLVLAIHGAVQGLEVQVNVDTDRVFSAPPIRMPNR